LEDCASHVTDAVKSMRIEIRTVDPHLVFILNK